MMKYIFFTVFVFLLQGCSSLSSEQQDSYTQIPKCSPTTIHKKARDMIKEGDKNIKCQGKKGTAINMRADEILIDARGTDKTSIGYGAKSSK